MREEGLEVVYNKRRARGYSSYAGEVSKAPENLVNRISNRPHPHMLSRNKNRHYFTATY